MCRAVHASSDLNVAEHHQVSLSVFLPTQFPNHFANTLALTPFPRGSDEPMVWAYFGAKKRILVERPNTHRGTLSLGRGCDGPSS